jgi:hypothetical protein
LLNCLVEGFLIDINQEASIALIAAIARSLFSRVTFDIGKITWALLEAVMMNKEASSGSKFTILAIALLAA